MKWHHVLWLIGAAAAYFIGWILLRSRNPIDGLKTEIAAIDAKAKAKRIEVERGKTAALAQIETEHRQAIRELNADDKRLALSLRGNPSRLASFLVRKSGPGSVRR